MPRLAPEDKTPVVTYPIKLRADIYAQIVGYGSYLNEQNPSAVGHVITEAFNSAIKGDSDWKSFWDKYALKFQTAALAEAPGKRGRKPKEKAKTA